MSPSPPSTDGPQTVNTSASGASLDKPRQCPITPPKNTRRPPITESPARNNKDLNTSENPSSQMYNQTAWEKPPIPEVAPHPPQPVVETSGPKDLGDKGLFGFMDPQAVKDQVQKALEKREPYNVFQYYKDDADSVWPRIAKASWFENTTLAVIAINAAYIAIDTDWNKPEPLTCSDTYSLTESPAFFQFMEHAFCVYFTFEWVCRFMSFKKKTNGLKDGWFVFDSVLVFMMVMETWVLLIVMAAAGGGESPVGGTSILRLFRLLRLSRLMRMLRSLPELMILIKGMATAMKSVAYVMALQVLITYVFAIAFTQLAVGTKCPDHMEGECDVDSIGHELFANIGLSMYSLWIYATLLDDLIVFTDALRFQQPVLLFLGFVYIILAAWTVMNMLIGVLCEVVSAVAENERDDIRTQTLTDKMREVVESLDSDNNQMLSYKEFVEIMAKPAALNALEDVGVNPVGIVDFVELFFFEDGQPVDLTFEKFMEVVLDLREANNATVKDMLHVWMKIKKLTNKEISDTKHHADVFSQTFDEKSKRLFKRMDNIQGALATGISDMQKLTSKYG